MADLGPTLRSEPDAAASSPAFSGDKATFSLANVACTLYPGGESPGAQVARLRRAMMRLETTA